MTKAVNGTGETRTPVTAIKSRVPYHLGHNHKSRCLKIDQIQHQILFIIFAVRILLIY